MKHLLNTLFITSEDIYLTLDGENVLANRNKETVARYPLHTLNSIISFSHNGATPALMGACVQRNVDLVFCSPWGKFLARTTGFAKGNVLLRREQYRIADKQDESCKTARNMIFGKLYNSRWSLERSLRDHALRMDENKIRDVIAVQKEQMEQAVKETDLYALRGIEGIAAKAYFDVFDELILRNKEVFKFQIRSRRPPLDPVNAMLSFAYVLLSADCASALESAGLDAFVGFMHRDKPGRKSLALDIMEELRPCIADRFVLTLINNRVIDEKDFSFTESKAVLLTDQGRKKFLHAWQNRKQETLIHPFLHEKIPWGLVPYMQALLLARYIRGDLDAYPPFLWK